MAHVHTFGVVAPAAAGIIQFVSSTHPPSTILIRLRRTVLGQRRVMSPSQSRHVLTHDPRYNTVHIH